ncbi:hypothetical protein AB4144_60265, partial [Rhizobiaceae sp. 2RAB30]
VFHDHDLGSNHPGQFSSVFSRSSPTPTNRHSMPAHPLVMDAKRIHATQMLRIHVTSLAGAAHPDRQNFARADALQRPIPSTVGLNR